MTFDTFGEFCQCNFWTFLIPSIIKWWQRHKHQTLEKLQEECDDIFRLKLPALVNIYAVVFTETSKFDKVKVLDSLRKKWQILHIWYRVHCAYCLDIAKQMSNAKEGKAKRNAYHYVAHLLRATWVHVHICECMCTLVSALCTFCPGTVNSFKSALDSPWNGGLLVFISHPSALKYHAVTWGKKVFHSVWQDHIEILCLGVEYVSQKGGF